MFNCDQVFSAFPRCTLAGKAKEWLVHEEHCYPNIKLLLQVVMVDDLAEKVIKYWLCTFGTVKTVRYTE